MPFIHSDIIKNVEWKSNCKINLASSVDVWKVKISSEEKLSDLFLQMFNEEEKEKASRYHNEDDKQRYIFGRGALRFLLGKYLNKSADTIQFTIGTDKKPLLNKNSGSDLHFNISHSGDFDLIAISDSEVGVDIEKINPDFSYKEILKSNFTKEEIDFIQDSLHPIEAFYLLWTRKESLVKATSKGLTDNLNLISTLDGLFNDGDKILDSHDSWDIHSFKIEENYLGSVACNMHTKTINFLNTSPLFFLETI
ncbi:MAG TPA: 4'-phosphopantetheinyl transferase superfamily protein [Puia sp.]|jgi:4'-phosphopantetheinyl transferase|nr:4'-phosphopantetheinyl transferase superfamily protein [Puia sp.]